MQNVKPHDLRPSLHMIRVFKSRMNMAGNVKRIAEYNDMHSFCRKPKVGR